MRPDYGCCPGNSLTGPLVKATTRHTAGRMPECRPLESGNTGCHDGCHRHDRRGGSAGCEASWCS
ncbi:hypothetical protein CBM2586_P70016 [Cupriavidus phytorum]|uniref:Uncharacterized protein n=2 Tax=Cupriavidus TaxID=106589 RepID=A0A976FTW1_9BURK|nr:hypothetical protein CBM2586_P70016 [Cupriavidus taiwanensis]SPD62106.1 protein of unknown function [Cupriavidus neocaledonicus]